MKCSSRSLAQWEALQANTPGKHRSQESIVLNHVSFKKASTVCRVLSEICSLISSHWTDSWDLQRSR
jgi:hypothetical protein